MADSGKPIGPPDPSGAGGGTVYGFTEKGFDRVARATKLVEKELVPAVAGRRGRYPIGAGGGGGRVAVVKTTITARSGKTPGKGTVTLQDKDEDGDWTDGADDVEVESPYGSSIAVGKWVTLVRSSGGLTVFGADC